MSRHQTHVARAPVLHLERLEPQNVWCECEVPDWRTCGPLFGRVRECARCGSPAKDEIGRWP